MNIDAPPTPRPPRYNMGRNHRDFSSPSAADFARDRQKQLQPFPPFPPPRSKEFDDPPGRYSSGPPPPFRDWYPSPQSPYPRTRWTAAEQYAYWEPRAASRHCEGQPPPVDRENGWRERGRGKGLIEMHHNHFREAMVGIGLLLEVCVFFAITS